MSGLKVRMRLDQRFEMVIGGVIFAWIIKLGGLKKGGQNSY